MSSELTAPARRDAPSRRTDAGPARPAPRPGAEEDDAAVSEPGGSGTGGTGITCRLEELLVERAMTLTELSRLTGITMANLSIMKNNKAKAIRMTTIAALCRALRVTPGQLLVLEGDST